MLAYFQPLERLFQVLKFGYRACENFGILRSKHKKFFESMQVSSYAMYMVGSLHFSRMIQMGQALVEKLLPCPEKFTKLEGYSDIIAQATQINGMKETITDRLSKMKESITKNEEAFRRSAPGLFQANILDHYRPILASIVFPENVAKDKIVSFLRLAFVAKSEEWA
jgi:hypothetical protein